MSALGVDVAALRWGGSGDLQKLDECWEEGADFVPPSQEEIHKRNQKKGSVASKQASRLREARMATMRKRQEAARNGRKGAAWQAVWGDAAERELLDSPKASASGAASVSGAAPKAKHTPVGEQASAAQQPSPRKSPRRLFVEPEAREGAEEQPIYHNPPARVSEITLRELSESIENLQSASDMHTEDREREVARLNAARDAVSSAIAPQPPDPKAPPPEPAEGEEPPEPPSPLLPSPLVEAPLGEPNSGVTEARIYFTTPTVVRFYSDCGEVVYMATGSMEPPPSGPPGGTPDTWVERPDGSGLWWPVDLQFPWVTWPLTLKELLLFLANART